MVIKARKSSMTFNVEYDPKSRTGKVEITFHDLRKSCRQTAERLLQIMLDVDVKKRIAAAGQSHDEMTTCLIKGERFADVWLYEFTVPNHLAAASAAAATNQGAPMAETACNPEDALFNAGASDGYYEIVGATYSQADHATGTPATATIDLSTEDQTGCLLTHDYSTGKTTLKWNKEDPLGPDMYGTADDVQVAIEDITHGQLDHGALFDAFQVQLISGNASAAS